MDTNIFVINADPYPYNSLQGEQEREGGSDIWGCLHWVSVGSTRMVPGVPSVRFLGP